MTREPDPEPDGTAPPTETRLRTHITDILAAGAIPAAARDDLADELYGHLVERIDGLRARGISEADAVMQAIADFGGVNQLSADLGRVYHSRLWASTIGVLLPAMATRDHRPGVIGWLRFTLLVTAAFYVFGMLAAIWQATPLRAVGGVIAGLIGLAVMWLAFGAIARGQRWALWYAIAIAAELLVWGIGSAMASAVGGAIAVPLGAILAIGVLLGVAASWERLTEFVGGSRPISRWLAMGVAGALLVSGVVPPALAALPDPTQASPEDLALRVSVRCDRGGVNLDGLPRLSNVQRVTIVTDMSWRRADVLPNGLNGALNASDFGDTAGFRLVGDPVPVDTGLLDVALPDWDLATGDVPVVDVDTGETAGWFGSTSPSVALIPATIGSFTVGIDTAFIRGGHTIRITWLLAPISGGNTPWPRVEVAYAHLDRFLLLATAGCGETTTGQTRGRFEPLH